MTIGIYCFTNKKNGKQYIGQSFDCELRYKDHLKNYKNDRFNNHFYNALKLYGVNEFHWEIIVELEMEETKEEMQIFLDAYEIIEIYERDTYNNGYNSTKGGQGGFGYKCSDEKKRKIGLAHSGEKCYFFGKSGKLHPRFGLPGTQLGKIGKLSSCPKRVEQWDGCVILKIWDCISDVKR